VRAIGLRAPGAPLERLDLPVPEPSGDELLIRVIASSINPVDGYIVTGTYGSGDLRYPVVPGRDVCGVVERTGPDANGFAAGDLVLGCWTRPEFRHGAWAEYMTVPVTSAITHCPPGLGAHEAAALPLAAATAQLAIDALDPLAGEPVLIVGAGGAVGCYAVQLAAGRGASVIATAKPGEAQRVRALGAEETIDYSQVDVGAAVRELHPGGVPKLLDIVSDKPELLRLAELVPRGGRVASARFAADKRVLVERGIAAINVLATGQGPEVLAPVLSLAEAGKLQILVSDVRPLDELPSVVPQFERGGRGKVVVAIGA
jgi:NADPH:quinone reductase